MRAALRWPPSAWRHKRTECTVRPDEFNGMETRTATREQQPPLVDLPLPRTAAGDHSRSCSLAILFLSLAPWRRQRRAEARDDHSLACKSVVACTHAAKSNCNWTVQKERLSFLGRPRAIRWLAFNYVPPLVCLRSPARALDGLRQSLAHKPERLRGCIFAMFLSTSGSPQQTASLSALLAARQRQSAIFSPLPDLRGKSEAAAN